MQDLPGARIGLGAPDRPAALRAVDPLDSGVAGIQERRALGQVPDDQGVLETGQLERVAGLAARLGTTRSAAAVDLWGERLDGAVVAIGNAPTALFRLLEITGPDFAWSDKSDHAHEGKARKFVAAVNLAVRQAISAAINRSYISNAVYNGYAPATNPEALTQTISRPSP